ncbi:MAG: MmgE/PrpD family protein [Syntrophales bacterium]|jgi:2-methylcitrate dehydratase PrpD|nr:MmgE/PrpD family protein [Syntrophales bacterium]
MSQTMISSQLAKFSCGLRFEDLSGPQVAKMKGYILDWLGSAYAGRDQPSIRMIRKVADSLGGNPESTSIPDGTKTSCLLASLVNGAASHVVEMDDLHRESIIHPASVIFPVVLALGERRRASGKELIVAATAGYEVGIRVALSVGTTHYHYWHTTGTCGTYGAAAAATKLLDLSEEQFVWAMGSAGTQAAGLWEFLADNAMSKQLHLGKAAMNGLLAALLAKEGFTGARKILEGEKGFFHATSQNFDQDKCTAGLGEVFHSDRNSIKFYASCGHTHSAIDAVLLATGSKTFKASEVAEVRLRVYQGAVDLLGEIEPKSPYLAKFHLPFCIATALAYGHVQLCDFTETRLDDPDLKELMSKVHFVADPELTKVYPRKWPASVTITLADGRELQGYNEYPKGDPENPLSVAELVAKFRSLTDGIISEDQANRIIDKVMNLEKMADTNELLI